MTAMKIGPVWACAALLAASLTACGDDGGGSSSGSGGASSSSSDSSTGTGTGPTSGTNTTTSTGTPTSSTGNPSSSDTGTTDVSSSSNTGTTDVSSSSNTGTTDVSSSSDTGTTDVSSSSSSSTTDTSSSTGIQECDITEFFGDATCDACFLPACCDFAQACIDDFNSGGEDCAFQDTGEFNPDGRIGAGLLACLGDNCAAECGGGGGICDTGLSFGDDALDQCLGDNCCDEFHACNDADSQACIDCLNAGGGALCDDAIACFEANCSDIQTGICDTGLSFGDSAVDTCLGDNCCSEWQSCVADDPQACIDCVNDGGTDPLCSDALACGDANGCFG